jgi:hypothetical protein
MIPIRSTQTLGKKRVLGVVLQTRYIHFVECLREEKENGVKAQRRRPDAAVIVSIRLGFVVGIRFFRNLFSLIGG